jgi:hypothetical protein
MISQKQIDEAAILWNKTKDPYYKDLWYSLIREWSYGKNINNISSVVRWNVNKRETGFYSTNGSTRVSNVRRRSQRNNSKIC